MTEHCRLAVLADIHGNLTALQAVLDDCRDWQPHHYLVAGDSTGGCQPNECIKLLRTLNPYAIRGNNEEYMLMFHNGGPDSHLAHSKQWAAGRWSYRNLDESAIDWIKALPEELTPDLPGADPIRLVHGSPRSITESILPHDPPIERLFRQQSIPSPGRTPLYVESAIQWISESVLICAHSHISWQSYLNGLNGRIAFNPGAISCGFGRPRTTYYARLEWTGEQWQSELRQIPYDVDEFARIAKETGYADAGGAFARSILLAVETGHNYPGWLAHHAFQYALKAGESTDPIPDAIYEQAVASFDWDGAIERNCS